MYLLKTVHLSFVKDTSRWMQALALTCYCTAIRNPGWSSLRRAVLGRLRARGEEEEEMRTWHMEEDHSS
jgi:hypothetical protein